MADTYSVFKIIEYNNHFDNLKNLKKLVNESYIVNKDFFGQDISPFKIKFVYTRRDFNKHIGKTSTPDWLVGVVIKRQLIIFSPAVFDIVSSHTKSEFKGVLSHEISHIFKNDIFSFDYPTWLSEGLSGYISSQYKKIRAFKDVDFRLLHRKEDWVGNTNYPQAYLFFAYLIKRFGKEKMIKLLKSLRGKEPIVKFETKFKELFELSFNKTTKDWRKDISRKQ